MVVADMEMQQLGLVRLVDLMLEDQVVMHLPEVRLVVPELLTLVVVVVVQVL